MSSIAAWRLPKALAVRLLLLAGMVGLTAGSGAAQTPLRPAFDHEGLARQALERHIRPVYASFANIADKLRLTLETACQRRDASDADAVKSAYHDLVLAWSRTEHLRFGPVIDANR